MTRRNQFKNKLPCAFFCFSNLEIPVQSALIMRSAFPFFVCRSSLVSRERPMCLSASSAMNISCLVQPLAPTLRMAETMPKQMACSQSYVRS